MPYCRRRAIFHWRKRRGGSWTAWRPPTRRAYRRAPPSDVWADLWNAFAAPGDRHPTLNRLVGHLREHGIGEPEAVALEVLWDEARCRPPKDEDEVRLHVADLFARYAAETDAGITPAPWPAAEAAFLALPVWLQQRFCAGERQTRGAAVSALRRGAEPAVVFAWLLDLADGDARQAAGVLRWAMRRAVEEVGGVRAEPLPPEVLGVASPPPQLWMASNVLPSGRQRRIKPRVWHAPAV